MQIKASTRVLTYFEKTLRTPNFCLIGELLEIGNSKLSSKETDASYSFRKIQLIFTVIITITTITMSGYIRWVLNHMEL